MLGFAAVNTGNNLLFLIVATLLAFMAVTGVIGKRNIEQLELELAVPDEIHAGVATLLRIRISNQRRYLPAFLIRVGLDRHEALIPYIPCQGEASAPCTAVFPQRGRHPLAEVQLFSRFPVAFFRRGQRVRLDRHVLVFPAPRPCPLHSAGAGARTSGAHRSAGQHGQHGELARIADYTGTESLKRIHWKLSARHEELKVKDMEELAAEPVIIVPESLPGSGLEERLGCAAWLADHLLRLGRPVGMELGATRIPPALGRDQKLRLLRALALYGHD